MDRREFVGAIGMGAAAAAISGIPACARRARQGRPPNFVFMLVDDLGWRDLGCYGSTFQLTPNIDALAAQGIRFTDAYAASPVCSPTRASIMTGRHPARLAITDWIGGSQRGLLLPAEYERQLPLEELTIAEALKEAGYATAFIGKWHLGDPPFFPENQGFDVNIGGHAAGHPASYFWPYRGAEDRATPWDVPDLGEGEEGEYLTDRLTEEALRFVDAAAPGPFLLFLSHYAVHTPIQSKPGPQEIYSARAGELPPLPSPGYIEEHERARTRIRQDDPAYAGMVHSTDESVGRILDRLDSLGLAGDTVVVFFSDNGGLSTLAGRRTGPTANLPLRAGKGWLYEGGIREPLIVRWPGRVRGGTISSAPVMSTDLFPTILDQAGVPLPGDRTLDGISLVPLLTGTGEIGERALHWHFPHYHGSGNRPSGAIRVGNMKLIEWFENGTLELYDLGDDPGEERDLAEERPGQAEELAARLRTWRLSVGARMPRQEPGERDRQDEP